MTAENAKLSYRLDGKVAVIDLDDGKANALAPDLIEAIAAALERAASEARAVVIGGRPGRFSAGFDLSIRTAGADPARALITQGAELLLAMYMHPQPVVIACSGHALAAGALMLLAADTRIGVRGDFKIGLNEVAIGLRLPIFAIELARDRLSKRHLVHATVEGSVYTPDEACDVGFLDRLVEPEALAETTLAEARRLAELPTGALAQTKELVRAKVVEHIRETLAADMQAISPPSTLKER